MLLIQVTTIPKKSFKVTAPLARDLALHEIVDSCPEHLVTLGSILGLPSITRILVWSVGVREPRWRSKSLDIVFAEYVLPSNLRPFTSLVTRREPAFAKKFKAAA